MEKCPEKLALYQAGTTPLSLRGTKTHREISSLCPLVMTFASRLDVGKREEGGGMGHRLGNVVYASSSWAAPLNNHLFYDCASGGT